MVYHVFSNGEIKTNITGHVVKMEHVEQAYRLINEIENRSIKKEEDNERVRTERIS